MTIVVIKAQKERTWRGHSDHPYEYYVNNNKMKKKSIDKTTLHESNLYKTLAFQLATRIKHEKGR